MCVPCDSLKNEEQGLQYPDGHCEVGIDLWRKLNKYDFVSYPYKNFTSINELIKNYRIIPIRKGYYLTN